LEELLDLLGKVHVQALIPGSALDCPELPAQRVVRLVGKKVVGPARVCILVDSFAEFALTLILGFLFTLCVKLFVLAVLVAGKIFKLRASHALNGLTLLNKALVTTESAMDDVKEISSTVRRP
jgi:hypothetical protein